MKLEDFLVVIGLKLLIIGYLENTLRYTTPPPFKNSEKSLKTQALKCSETGVGSTTGRSCTTQRFVAVDLLVFNILQE